ncbi:MAG: NUDIX domain-containing protein [bacterium]|nr:NUDIX domain-containing protein [bacterium]
MKKQTTGVYLIRDNKVLFLVREKKHDTRHIQGIYLPIGGHVELGEEIEECAKREVFEESGVNVKSVELKGILFIRGQASGETDIIVTVFTSTDFEGEPVSGNEGHFEWVDREEFDKINLYEGDKVFLKYMFSSQFFVLDFQYKGFEFINYKILKLINQAKNK